MKRFRSNKHVEHGKKKQQLTIVHFKQRQLSDLFQPVLVSIHNQKENARAAQKVSFSFYFITDFLLQTEGNERL